MTWWVDSRQARALRGEIEKLGWRTEMIIESAGPGVSHYAVQARRGQRVVCESWVVTADMERDGDWLTGQVDMGWLSVRGLVEDG